MDLSSEGKCDTTMTDRFLSLTCKCPTYLDNLGPCLDHLDNGRGSCVYCDHLLSCNPTEVK